MSQKPLSLSLSPLRFQRERENERKCRGSNGEREREEREKEREGGTGSLLLLQLAKTSGVMEATHTHVRCVVSVVVVGANHIREDATNNRRSKEREVTEAIHQHTNDKKLAISTRLRLRKGRGCGFLIRNSFYSSVFIAVLSGCVCLYCVG